ncbi:hypothetical protein NO2_0628 [Candidatus Termititenax persephonae]|uniref:DUF306 domain-containing protein n=1 Tax=Candidatus Termititenax persephonae TaxID=2218525 RepID=A0A388TG09_9BACT|nr:hypothetical protein NO2_0628 [Candidatus Termititenax persephonae]
MQILKTLAVAVLMGGLLLAAGDKPAAALQKTPWHLTKLDGQKVSAPQVQLILQEDGTANGHGGVNRFAGTYALGGQNKLSFSALASTKMLGISPEANAVEDNFFKALPQTKTYKIQGRRLFLLDAQGRPLAEFEALP